MFTVTSGAASHLAERLKSGGSVDAKAFTFAREDHGWRLRLVDRINDDLVIHYGDTVVMVLDREASLQLAGRRLELRETESGPRLRMPQAERAGG